MKTFNRRTGLVSLAVFVGVTFAAPALFAGDELREAKDALDAILTDLARQENLLKFCVVGGIDSPQDEASAPTGDALPEVLRLPPEASIGACTVGDVPGAGLRCPAAEAAQAEAYQCSFRRALVREASLGALTKQFVDFDQSFEMVAQIVGVRQAVGEHHHAATPQGEGDCPAQWVKLNATYTLVFGLYQRDEVSVTVPLSEDPATLALAVANFEATITAASRNYHATHVGPSHLCLRMRHPEPRSCHQRELPGDRPLPGGELPGGDVRPLPGGDRPLPGGTLPGTTPPGSGSVRDVRLPSGPMTPGPTRPTLPDRPASVPTGIR